MSSFTPPITVTSTGGGTTTSVADVDLYSAYYEVVTAFTGVSVGDVLQRISFVKTADQTSGGADIWINVNTTLALASAPANANIKPRVISLTKDEMSTLTIKTLEQPTSPLVTVLGKPDDAVTADIAGTYSIISGLKKLLAIAVGMFDKLPALVSGKIPVTGTLDTWETVEWRMDSSGVLVFEKEKNGAAVRQRTWTKTTDATGTASYVAGDWA